MGGSGDNAEVGAAWVFLRSGTTWAQQGEKLTGKEEVREGESAGRGEFGFSVALSAEGEYALIGGPGDNGGAGAAWVFLRTGHDLGPAGEAHRESGEEIGAGEFGKSVALSEKGEYALIGAPGDNRRHRRGVGVHALRHDLDPAGGEARREKRRRDRRGRVRQERGDLRKRRTTR